MDEGTCCGEVSFFVVSGPMASCPAFLRPNELLTVIGNGERENARDLMFKKRTPSAQRVSVPKTIKIKSNARAYNLFRAHSDFIFSPLLVMF